MWDIIRESTVGEIINLISRGRLLPYPDQRPGFVIPERYLLSRDETSPTPGASFSTHPVDGAGAIDESAKSPQWLSDAPTRIPSSDTIRSEADRLSKSSAARATKDLEGGDVHPDAEASPKELEQALETAQVEVGDYILVDWYRDDDPENPRNWSSGKRFFVLLEICLLT